MSALGMGAHVDHHSFESVCPGSLVWGQRKRGHIELLWEFETVDYFEPVHGLVVKVESFQSEEDVSGEAAHIGHLGCVDLLEAVVTVELVAAFKGFAVLQMPQTLHQTALVLHVHWEGVEFLRSLANVAIFTGYLDDLRDPEELGQSWGQRLQGVQED